jgi:hypothetical protein
VVQRVKPLEAGQFRAERFCCVEAGCPVAWWPVGPKPFRYPGTAACRFRAFSMTPAKGGSCSRFPSLWSRFVITSANAGALTSSPERSRKTVIVVARLARIDESLAQAGIALVATAAACADQAQQASVSSWSSVTSRGFYRISASGERRSGH